MESPSRNWRLNKQRYQLKGTACECGAKHFPPRDICPGPLYETARNTDGQGDPSAHAIMVALMSPAEVVTST